MWERGRWTPTARTRAKVDDLLARFEQGLPANHPPVDIGEPAEPELVVTFPEDDQFTSEERATIRAVVNMLRAGSFFWAERRRPSDMVALV